MSELTKKIAKLVVAVSIVGLVLLGLGPITVNANEIHRLGAVLEETETEWVLLEAGATHRYSFTYHSNTLLPEPSEVTVQLESRVADAFSFEIKRADNLTLIGAGALKQKFTGSTGDDKKLIWVGGRTLETITLYVIVKNESVFSRDYRLTMLGDDISFPSAITGSTSSDHPPGKVTVDLPPPADAISNPAVFNPAGTKGPPDKSAIKKLHLPLESAPGTSPATALSPTDEWLMLGPNEARWYTFQYDFNQHAINPSAVTLQINTDVVEALSFQVMTSRMKIFGEGKPHNLDTGSLNDDSRILWTSQTLISGTYYVEIQNDSAYPVLYQFSVTGQEASK